MPSTHFFVLATSVLAKQFAEEGNTKLTLVERKFALVVLRWQARYLETTMRLLMDIRLAIIHAHSKSGHSTTILKLCSIFLDADSKSLSLQIDFVAALALKRNIVVHGCSFLFETLHCGKNKIRG